MLHYPSIENHHNAKNYNYWVSEFPELKTIKLVAQQKYDGSNLGIEFAEDGKATFCTRNTQLSDTDNFCGLREVIKQNKYANMLETIKQWKSTQTEIKTINLFGEFYGPGIQKRINYGTEKQIKFFDVYFNGEIQSTSRFTKWMEDLKLTDFMVETLLTGTLDELISSLEKCQSLVQHPIEGIVVKPLDTVIKNNESHFCIKIKVTGFDDIKVEIPKTKKPKKENEKTRNLIDYITENRIQDCKGKQPWKNVDHLIKCVIEDAFDDFKKVSKATDSNIVVEELTPKECLPLNKKALNLCKKLYNLNTGDLI